MTAPRPHPHDTDPEVPGGGAPVPGDDEAGARDGGGAVALRYDDGEEQRAELAETARARRVPYVMTAVTAGTGIAGWGAAQVAAALGGNGAWSAVVALVWLGSAIAVPAARAVLRDRIADRWVRTWWAATACAAVWVDAVTALGSALLDAFTATAAVATLVLGSATLGAGWRDEHDVPHPADADDPVPAEEPAAVELDAGLGPEVQFTAAQLEAEAIELAWDTEVAAGEHPIAHRAELTGRTELPHGWRWEVRLHRGGSVGCSDLVGDGSDARLAFKLGKRATHVILEPAEDDPREDRATLTVVTRDVLAAGVTYDGPRYQDGLIEIGAVADGAGHAHWATYDETGVLCGLITGGQGSGKSALMAALGLAYRASGEWTVLFGDGDPAGNSSRLLAEVAHDFARGPAEVLEQLEGLEAVVREVRGYLMGTLTDDTDGKPTPITRPGQRPVDKILPCARFPGFVWVIDEFHKLANDPDLQAVDFVARFAKLVRLFRKYGGAFIVGTQSALGDDFDGDSALRAMLASGNMVALRSKNKSEQGIVSDGLSPHLLPKGGGYALQGDARPVMIRTAHPRGMQEWAPRVVQVGRPDERSWAAFRRHRTVRKLDLAADYAEQMARLAALDEALATGAPLPGEATGGEDHADDDGLAVSVGGFTVPVMSGNVVPIRAELGDPVDQAPPPVEPRPLPEKARLVLEDLRAHPGPRRSADIAAATGMSGPDVSKALTVLRGRGLAHRPSGVQGVHVAGPHRDQLKDQEAI